MDDDVIPGRWDWRWDWRHVGRRFDELADAHDAFPGPSTTSDPAAPAAQVDAWVEDAVSGLLDGPPAHVLDLGSGSGRLSALAVTAGHHVRLMDASARMLDLARIRLAEARATADARTGAVTGHGDAEVFHADAIEMLSHDTTRFHTVFAIGEVIAYVDSPARLLTLIRRRLLPGGRLLMTYMRRDGLLPRLSDDEITADDGRVLTLVERSAPDAGQTLWAKAFSDDEMATLLRTAGLQLLDLAAPPGGTRAALVACAIPGRILPGAPFDRPATTAYPETARWLTAAVRNARLDTLTLRIPVRACALSDCGGICCSDGAYLEADEPELLGTLTRERAAALESLGADLRGPAVIPGSPRRDRSRTWKTATRATVSPEHGVSTCVLRRADGACCLQLLAERERLHPWHFKPAVCWLHPLDILTEPLAPATVALSRGTAPPPGSPPSVGSAPCSLHRADGPPAIEALHRELGYLFALTGWTAEPAESRTPGVRFPPSVRRTNSLPGTTSPKA